jgi:hypothetical protein
MSGLDMDRFVARRGRRLGEGLGERRVGVDGLVNILNRGLEADGEAVFGDEFGGVAADDMGAVDLARLGVGDDLYEAVAVGGSHGLAGSGEGELADLVVEFLLLGGLFGESGGGDLRLAVGAAWEAGDALRRAVAEHAVDRVDRLESGDVGQPGRPDDVAGREDALDGALVVVVHLHVAALEFELGAASEQALGVGGDADGGEQHVGLDLHALVALDEVNFHAVFADAEVFALGVHVNLDALLLEGAMHGLGGVLVLDREHVGQHLDESDLGAEGVEEVGELHADGAGADDGDGLGLDLEVERLAGGHHADAIILQARDAAHLAAGADEDALGLEEGALFVARGDLDHAGGGHMGVADDVVHLVLAEEELDALGHLLGDIARAQHDGGEVERDLLDDQADGIGLLDLLVELRALEQGLGGDAAPVQTGAARALHFDAGHFFAQLSGANRARVARRAAADDDEVVVRSSVSHGKMRKGFVFD